MPTVGERPALIAVALVMTLGAKSIVTLHGQSTPLTAQKPRLSRTIQVDRKDVWTITDVDVHPGEKLRFTAQGDASCAGAAASFGPEGIPRGFRDLLRILPLPQAGRGAVIGRVGEPGVAQPFVVGPSLERVSPSGGVLSLGVNRADSDACDTRFTVRVDVFGTSGDAQTTVARAVEQIEGVDAALLNRLPRRITDKEGNAGDMVNFLILGSDAGMKQVFTAAGWVTVDADVKNAILSRCAGQPVEGIVPDTADVRTLSVRAAAGLRLGACRADQGRRIAASPARVACTSRGRRNHVVGRRGDP